ncbi:MAG: ankyrin repeat domain-containing protein [Bacteroidota bacterium]
MSSITGIRILAKKDKILRFRTFLLHQDVQKLPRTHGFGVMVLLDKTYGKEDCPLMKDIGKVDLDKTLQYGQKYVTKLELSDFENFPLTPEFLQSGNYLDDTTQQFTNEEWLPQAVHEMEVTDKKWLEHLTVGQTWETASCDLDSPFWRLTKLSDATQCYQVFQSRADRKWTVEYGKVGKKPKILKPRWTNIHFALSAIKKKLSKSGGYKIQYQNFDTDYDIEQKLLSSYAGKANLNTREGRQYGLEKAIYERNPKQVAKLIELGVDCNGRTGKKIPLEMLTNPVKSMKKTLACAKLLLDNGADVNLNTPIISLFLNKKALPLIEMLLDYGADLTKTDKHNEDTALHLAVLFGPERTALALDNGADPNQKSRRGLTAKEYLMKFKNRPNQAAVLQVFEERGL